MTNVIIGTNGHRFKLIPINEVTCVGCFFKQEDEDCPTMYNEVSLCRHLQINNQSIIFEKLPSFKEDIDTFVEEAELTISDSGALKKFLSNSDAIRELVRIARNHEVI